MIDFEDTVNIGGVLLEWEAAFAKEFKIYTSTDSINWTVLYSTTEGPGGTFTEPGESIKLPSIQETTSTQEINASE